MYEFQGLLIMSRQSKRHRHNTWKQNNDQDLYTLLQIEKEATQEEIKRAYYKMSLKTHPDRCPQNEYDRATKAFQSLGKAYLILSTPELRRIYDNTGRIIDDSELYNAMNVQNDNIDWSTWFKTMFERVSFDTLDKVKQSYQKSDEEIQDLLKCYRDHHGDMSAIMSSMIFSTEEDESRFRQILQKEIKNKRIPNYKMFTNEPEEKRKKRKAQYKKEAKQAQEYKTAMQKARTGDTEGLMSAIALRQKERQESLFKNLATKYIKSDSNQKTKLEDPMTDAQFHALNKKLWGSAPHTRHY